jgi:muramoyltetrapeptide carboxypeptidase
MRILKPQRLQAGDVIGIAAPASPPASLADLNRGIAYLERIGFRVEAGKHIHRRHGYLAGTDRERAEDLNRFFASKHVKAIFTVRGGFGSHRILPLLRYDVMRQHPKILVGYSDITALHCALLSCSGVVSFSGPMVAGEIAWGPHGKREESFWRMLMVPEPPAPVRGRILQRARTAPRSLAAGRLLAGNLSLLEALVGTEYFPAFEQTVLMLEEIDERPYRIDRMLQHMKLAGVFRPVRALALGEFSGCVPARGTPSLGLREIFREAGTGADCPVLEGIPYGHRREGISFPVGVRVLVHTLAGRVDFLEAGVR